MGNDMDMKETIMVVDDNPANLDLLKSMLIAAGYDVRSAINGALALQSIENLQPDLILLDIQMPEMDGYEVCQKLKENPSFKDIPVLFISAFSELANKVTGFEAGAVDYITKPFQVEEVLLRVRTHLTIRNQQKELELKNKQLVEAAKFKEEVERITRHDLKGPLTPILCNPGMILHREKLTEKGQKAVKTIEKAGYRMLTMINRSLDLFKIEKGIYKLYPAKVEIIRLLERILGEKQSLIESFGVDIKLNLNGSDVNGASTFDVLGEEFLCMSLFDNLILNAIEASKVGDVITINLEVGTENRITIHNPAVVPEDVRSIFFEKYSTSGKSNGTGIGTYSAKLVTEAQNGSISLETDEASGTSITVSLPSFE